MKKIIYSTLFAGLALVSAACQKTEEVRIVSRTGSEFIVTGNIVNIDGTKVTYDFSTSGSPKSGIKPAWEVGDKIFGFDDKGKAFTFEVSDVSETGKANFTGTYQPGEGATTLFAVYYPEKTEFNDKNEIDVDLSTQSGLLDDSSPVILCATGTIEDNCAHFNFENQTAILGIYKMKVAPNAKISKVQVYGVATKGIIRKVAYKGGDKMTFVRNPETSCVTAELATPITADENGMIEVSSDAIEPYFSIVPSDSEIGLAAVDEDGNLYTNASSIQGGEILPGKYYYFGKVMTSEVASIEDNKYCSLKAAFEAANQSSAEETIITMLADESTSNSITVENANDKKIVLNLNGHKYVTSAGTAISSKTEFEIIDDHKQLDEQGTISAGNTAIYAEDSKLTIKAGHFYADNYTNGVVNLYAKSSADLSKCFLNITGGYIKATTTDDVVTSRNVSWEKVRTVNACGTVSITGGTIVATKGYAIRAYYGGGNFEIDGANIESEGYCPIFENTYSKTSYVFKSGYVKILGSGAAFGRLLDETTSYVTLQGGFFNKPVSLGMIDAGHFCSKTDKSVEYPYEIIEGTPSSEETVAMIGEAQYTTLADAITAANAATADVTVDLESDNIKLTDVKTEVGSAMLFTINNVNSKKVTINLNGHKIFAPEADTVFAVNTEAIFTDKSENKDGGIFGKHCVISTTANLTIDAGRYVSLNGVDNSSGVIRSHPNKLTFVFGGTAHIDASKGGNGIYVKSLKNKTSTVDINGGNIIAKDRAIYCHQYGTINVNTGSFETTENTQAIYCGSQYGKVNIKGGYFKKKSGDNPLIRQTKQTKRMIVVSGGYFSEDLGDPAPEKEEESTGFSFAENVGQISSDDMNYPFRAAYIGSEVAIVNGVKYNSFNEAADAATDAGDNVTIKLLRDASANVCDLTNKRGHRITLDLNGHELKASVSRTHFITTKGFLDITDNSNGTPGTITSNGYRVISLGSTGTVDIKRVNITGCTDKTASYTGVDSTLIVIQGVDEYSDASITVGEGAKIGSNNKVKTFRVAYGTLTVNDAELYCGREGSSYHVIYLARGGKVTINEGAHLRSWADKAIFRIGSSNSQGGTSLTINGGDFYSGLIFNYEGNDVSYSKVHVKGGYYSASKLCADTDVKKETLVIEDGKSLQVITPAHTYKWNGTEDLTYGYKVK